MSTPQPNQKATSTLVDLYYEEQKTKEEIMADEIIHLMKAIISDSSPSLKDWKKLLSSKEFLSIKDDVYFQKELVSFLEEIHPHNRFLVPLRNAIQSKPPKQNSAPFSMKRAMITLGIIVIISILIALIATWDGFLFELFAGLTGATLILPCWLTIHLLKPHLSFGKQLALAQLITIMIPFIFGIILDMSYASWEAYDFMIIACAIGLIQAPITMIGGIIQWIFAKAQINRD